MARLPRFVLPQQPHHILQHGNDRQLIFRDSDDYVQFLTWLRQSARECKVALHAYVLMPNHLHLVATPASEAALAQMMQRLGRLYVPWYNNKYQRTGSLFQGRFKTALIDPAYFLRVSRYIELNPVRARLASDPRDYPWSSYLHHAGVRADPVITDHALYWGLGNTPFQREAAYIAQVEAGIGAEELATINAAVLKGWPLGSAAFKAELQQKVQRQVLPAKRGRPFKVLPPTD